MSVEFIKNKTGSIAIDLAKRQQDQISYFTQSSIQEEINIQYLEAWADRKYITNDYFLNWIKAVFKTKNFLSFYKHLRYPLASSRLVNNKIKEQLKRVFHAEDSYFKYTIRGNDVDIPEELENEKFQEKLFSSLLFRHNDIVITDLKDINRPYRDFISIKNVVAIESKDGVIGKLAFTGAIKVNEEVVHGYMYLDNERYAFYNDSLDETPLLEVFHDLGECPADYISAKAFKDKDPVRESIFSYIVEEFEEYTFLKTVLRMTELNGAVPVVTTFNVKEKLKGGQDKSVDDGEPMSAKQIGGQKAEFTSEVVHSDSPLNPGTILKAPILKDDNGKIQTELAKDFFTFHYTPIEALDYLNNRIKEVEKDIVIALTGDYEEANAEAKNELQVSKSYENRQDKLRGFSNQLSRIRRLSDYKFLSMAHGRDSVMVDCFYGSDFFIESQSDLYDLLAKSPNTIERKNILVRLSQNRNKYNQNKAEREAILYELLPYASDKDFDKAIARGVVGENTFELQTRFNYWIGKFESIYGDLVFFWNLYENKADSEKLSIINNLLTNIIKEHYEKPKTDSTPESVSGGAARKSA